MQIAPCICILLINLVEKYEPLRFYSLIFLFISLSFYGCKSLEQLDSSNSEPLFGPGVIDFSLKGDTEWSFLNEGFTGEGGEGYILSPDQYDDFILTLEFMPDENVNSGVFIRCPSGIITATDCYEINIWDDHVNQEFRTGAIVTHGPPLVNENSVGKWNQYRIRTRENRIEVWLNNKKTADLTNNKSSKGHIALQAMNGTIQFRNIFLKSL